MTGSSLSSSSNIPIQPRGTVISFLASGFDLLRGALWSHRSLAKGSNSESVFSAPACPYLRLVALAWGRQTASAAVFAVAFRCVVVVFRFIRAHKSKIAIYKGQPYCPIFKIHDLKHCARKESFESKIRNKITQ